ASQPVTASANQENSSLLPPTLGPSTAAMASGSSGSQMDQRPTNLPDLDKVPTLGNPAPKPDLIVPPLPKLDPAPGLVPVKAEKPAVDPGIVTLDHQADRPTGPAVRMINSKRITVNYEVKDVGPSGVSGVELWYTQDGSKTWKKRDVPPQPQPPYIIEVNDEGLYGFTLLAKNGIGLSKDPPQAGDLPQVWVEVDLTKPVVHLSAVNARCSGKSQCVVIHWTAADK